MKYLGIAGRYSDVMKNVMQTPFSHNWLIHKIINREINSAFRKYAKGSLLDIGCGDRPYEAMAKPYINKYIGLEHEETKHDILKADLIGSAYFIPAEAEAFDTILCTSVLEHLEEPSSAIKEASRVLVKGGFAIYLAPLFWHLHEEPRDFFRFSKYGLEYLFEESGLDVVELKPLSGFWATFGQEMVYYLWGLRKGGALNPLWWAIPVLGMLIQCCCYLLNKIDRAEAFTCLYLVVGKKR